MEAVHEAETSYTRELARRNPLEEHGEGASALQPPGMHPLFAKRPLYQHAHRNNALIAARRIAPPRLVLCGAEEIPEQHAAREPYSKSDTPEQEFQFAFLRGSSNTRSCLDFVAAPMCRARQIGEDGFRAAAWELESLLDRSLGDGHGNVPDVLTMGHHASLLADSNWTRKPRPQTV